MIDNRKLSAKSNCNSRARLQPMERRIAISRWRLTALASNMLAMLAHAIVSTSPNKTKSMTCERDDRSQEAAAFTHQQPVLRERPDLYATEVSIFNRKCFGDCFGSCKHAVAELLDGLSW